MTHRSKICLLGYKIRYESVIACRKAEFFYIISPDCDDKVMDVEDAETKVGSKVIVHDRNDEQTDNQLWYEDKEGYIRSKLNDFLLTEEGKTILTLILNHFITSSILNKRILIVLKDVMVKLSVYTLFAVSCKITDCLFGDTRSTHSKVYLLPGKNTHVYTCP